MDHMTIYPYIRTLVSKAHSHMGLARNQRRACIRRSSLSHEPGPLLSLVLPTSYEAVARIARQMSQYGATTNPTTNPARTIPATANHAPTARIKMMSSVSTHPPSPTLPPLQAHPVSLRTSMAVWSSERKSERELNHAGLVVLQRYYSSLRCPQRSPRVYRTQLG